MLIESVNPQTNVNNFFEALALCHTVEVITSSDDNSTETPSNQESLITSDIIDRYQASSPDEKAILEGCAKLGLIFQGTNCNSMYLTRIFGGRNYGVAHYERLHVLEFSSERKRMSIIVRDEMGIIWLYSKGAEAAILPRCKPTFSTALTDAQIMDYAKEGLRTLAVAKRRLTEEEYARFVTSCKDINIQITDRNKLLAACYETIEVGKC